MQACAKSARWTGWRSPIPLPRIGKHTETPCDPGNVADIAVPAATVNERRTKRCVRDSKSLAGVCHRGLGACEDSATFRSAGLLESALVRRLVELKAMIRHACSPGTVRSDPATAIWRLRGRECAPRSVARDWVQPGHTRATPMRKRLPAALHHGLLRERLFLWGEDSLDKVKSNRLLAPVASRRPCLNAG